MKKTIRITESELIKLVKKIINESFGNLDKDDEKWMTSDDIEDGLNYNADRIADRIEDAIEKEGENVVDITYVGNTKKLKKDGGTVNYHVVNVIVTLDSQKDEYVDLTFNVGHFPKFDKEYGNRFKISIYLSKMNYHNNGQNFEIKDPSKKNQGEVRKYSNPILYVLNLHVDLNKKISRTVMGSKYNHGIV